MKKKKQQKKIEIEKYLPGLFARTEGYASNVSKYYTAAVNALLDLAADVDLEPEEVFYFADHKKLSVKATNILRGLYSAVYQEIRRGVIAEWEFANLSNDAMIESIFGKGLQEDNHYARWFSRNHDAMDAFFKRKSEYGGLNLSQKVWKYTSQFKEEMELSLSASLGRGDSAATVSRRVRQYLQEPERLFRRVRDEEGNLKLSKRAAAYHPGRGEYRSSYKNAMRLARTETNMAYRAADNERWSQLDFVVGIEVKRSKRHFPCKICEALAGKFPKDFDFRGWHPQCRCYAVPILCSMDEMIAMQKRLLNDEEPGDFHSSNEVTEPHEDFKKWVSENQERIEGARSLPYWMRDNGKYVKRAATRSQYTGQGVRDIHDQRDTASPELKAKVEAKRKYNSYGEEWEKAYFNEENGGFNVYHKSHQFSKKKGEGPSKNGEKPRKSKMSGGEAEKFVGRTLAEKKAKQIEFLPENGNATEKPDLHFDGHTWDVKYIPLANENTIRKYIEEARKAERAIFYWDEENRLEDLKTAITRTIGKYKKRGELNTLPSVFYMNNDGELRCLFDNS